MEQAKRKRYPIGIQTFSEVIRRDCIYIDKTAMIYDLVTSVERAKAYLSDALAAMLDLGQGSGPMHHGFASDGKYAK